MLESVKSTRNNDEAPDEEAQSITGVQKALELSRVQQKTLKKHKRVSSPDTHFAPEDKDSDIINQSDGVLNMTLTQDKGRNATTHTFQEQIDKTQIRLDRVGRDSGQGPELLSAHHAVQESKLIRRELGGAEPELEFQVERSHASLQNESPS